MSRGYFFIGFGKNYVDEVAALVRTLNKFGNTYPISILCGESDIDYCNSLNLFDNIILYDFQNDLSQYDATHFEKYGGTPKIMMTDYSPYDETIFTDSDMLVQYNPNFLWDYMKSLNQPYIVTGGNTDSSNPLAVNFSKRNKLSMDEIYQIHSGLVYFDKNHKNFKNFIETLKFYWKNYYEENLNIPYFRQGKADEHAIFATINILKIGGVIDPTKIPTITHNYHNDIELPSKIVTGGNRYNVQAILEYPPPFIHMFRANGENHYEILYERLINL